MSTFLRFVLLSLAQWHMILSLILLVFVLSPQAEWVCVKGKTPVGCKKSMSVWKLGDAYADSVAYSVQALLILTALTNFAGVLIGASRVYKEVFATLNALTFVFSIIPWALVIGLLEKDVDKLGSAVWIAVTGSFIVMVAACLGLVAIFMPDDRRRTKSTVVNTTDEESKEQLLAASPRPKEGDSLLAVLDLFGYVAAVASIGSLFGLYQADQSFFSLSAQGCEVAVALLAVDVAVVTTCVHRRVFDVGMGAIVAASLSLVGWITGIPACVFTTIALGTFEFASSCALISLLASVGVFGCGIYIGTHYS